MNSTTVPASSSRTGSYLLRTKRILRQQLWLWPLIAAIALAFVAVIVRARMEGAIEKQLSTTLQAILNANVEALKQWSNTMISDAENLAEEPAVREQVTGLLSRIQPGVPPQATLLAAPEQARLRQLLNPYLDRRGFNGFVVLDTNLLVLASRRDQIVGMASPPGYAEQVDEAIAGTPSITPPFPSIAMLTDTDGNLRAGVPTMFALAPVRASDGRVIAVLGLRISPEKDFTRILTTARTGKTGETFAFDKNGLMLSESRFTDDLKKTSLIPDNPQSCSTLTLELRDPLIDLSTGKASPKRRAEQPLTLAVKQAIENKAGENVKGYRSYRGVNVAGAWVWLPEFEFGLATEISESEALQPLRVLRGWFWSLFGLLALGAILVYVLMRVSNRLQAAARKAALQVKQLGQYALGEQIGAGAFGSVYRGTHALMRRPVAVKLLQADAKDESTILRFEREVQMTCQLTHPNTIAIYDYGRTPEGVFYYAMEFLEGLTLDGLVKQFGPQPEGRVIAILRQACGSLAEAHAMGLVHRDIKPANIFLTRRGGMPDFVKVLDFGLVKASAQPNQIELTAANGTLGTPLYMSPEAVERPQTIDARSDIYSLGAVGYFLLTANHLFDSQTVGEVLLQQVKETPATPSQRAGRSISPDLESLLMQCLAKDPSERPANARALEDALSRCVNAGDWTREEAEAWWTRLAAARSERTTVTPAAS